MSKKSKHNVLAERPLADRIAKARQESRTQQALDLARQLYKQERNEAHTELLRQVTLERGQQLQAQGMLKDAVTVYTHALTLGGSPEYQASVAAGLATCGAVEQAQAATAQLPDPAARMRVLGHVVDAAIAKGPAGKSDLAPDLHAPFDLIQQAFADSEAGRDESARTALQGIGLQSPFLEWRVFLRGLLAYYAKDDVRALENWQRLDTQRLPARLAAPLRFGIDPAFREAQPAATRAILARQADLLSGMPKVATELLQSLRLDLPKEHLMTAFRKAEQVVAALRRERPELVPRLAHCFAWAIIDHGDPDDLERYRRIFGGSADDPRLYRLEAFALEARGLMPEAHKAWQDFMADVAAAPKIWPGETGKRVQAMIWARMAENGIDAPRRRNLESFLDIFEGSPKVLKPGPEECYRKAIELAPDRLASHLALFEFLRRSRADAKAKKVGHELLQRFPDHADTLEALGELYLDSDDYKKAQEYFEKSYQANPLDRTLRGKLARARRRFGVQLTIQKKFNPAREQYEQALKLWDGSKASLLCQWAVAEIKANDAARAEELIAQAQAEPDQRLACRYALVCEAARAKLAPKQKKELTAALKAALEQDPTAGEILVLLESAAQQRDTHDETFHGQKSQEKSVLKFLDRLSFDQFNESQLERLCAGLQALQARRPWMNCLEHSRRRHPRNPTFRLSFADYYLTAPNPEDKSHLARMHLDSARGLVENLPRGELQQQLLEQVQIREKKIAALTARFNMLDSIFDEFDDFDDDDDGDDGWDYV